MLDRDEMKRLKRSWGCLDEEGEERGWWLGWC